VQGDIGMGFGGLHGRGAKKQDPAIERELALSLDEVFHGCTKKMKISRRVRNFAVAYGNIYALSFSAIMLLMCRVLR